MQSFAALVSTALDLGGDKEKKRLRRKGRADVRKQRAVHGEVDDDQEVLPVSTPAPAAPRRRGARLSKKRARGEDDEEMVTPSPRVDEARRLSRSSSRDPKTRAVVNDIVASDMTPDQRSAVVYAMYSAAQSELDASGRVRFSDREIQRHLAAIQMTTGQPNLTWDSVRRRVSRTREKLSTSRRPGSGRKTVVTPQLRDVAKTVARRYAGDVSRTAMYHEVEASMAGQQMVSKSTFMRMMRGRDFKRRRVRYKPKLTEDHRTQRVDFAQHFLAADPELMRRIVFVDEKRFEVVTSGVLTLPAEDNTPKRSVQSKTNPVYVMVLVAVMEPRGDFGGVVGRHAFLDDTFALRNSKKREKGILEQKAVNVSGPTYIKAWRTVFEGLSKLIDEGQLEKPTAVIPLLMQDDNARPHRAVIDGVLVGEIICKMGLEEFGIHIRPLDPRQPPQSPDTNPLDTFVFRMMAMLYRRIRAESLVQSLAAGTRQRADVEVDLEVVDAESEREDDEHFDDDDEAGDEFLVRRVPLRCGMSRFKRNGDAQVAKCPGCQKVVKENDRTATQCDMRNSWWHASCVDALLETRGYERAMGTDVGKDEPWVCPQCMHHLCRTDSRSRDLCLKCGMPSARSGNAGYDMVTCDSECHGLFHRKCVEYDEEREDDEGNEAWYCPACSLVPEEEEEDEVDGEDGPEIEEHVCHENSVLGVLAAIDKSLERLPRDAFVRGFESRRVFLQKIVDAEGGNDYDMHYRGERKRRAKEAARKEDEARKRANVQV
jgi:hypothetical protein